LSYGVGTFVSSTNACKEREDDCYNNLLPCIPDLAGDARRLLMLPARRVETIFWPF